MTDLEKMCEQALYEEVQVLEDKRSIVRDNASGRLFYRKRLDIFNPEVFAWLKTHKSRYVPRIEAFWQDGEELVVVEELIQGETLEQRLLESENGLGMSFQERIRILMELCDGLSFLHSADPPIIHRDLKASNIMLTEDGVVKIIDYDAAKLYVEGQKRDTQLIGTQGSAAPEQYGFAASDARTDIYALGKLIGRMLPENVDAARIAARATAMDPSKRYASAAQIRDQIRRIREKPSGLDHIFGKIPGYDPANRRHRLLARLSIPVLCAVILGLGIFIYQTRVVIPREQQVKMTGMLESLSRGQMEPAEAAGLCRELLQERPYAGMDPELQDQFQEIAQAVILRCSSLNAGEKQETGIYLSNEGKDFLDVLREAGIDEETVKSISFGGQLQYLIGREDWDRAMTALKCFDGLPDEIDAREKVFRACEKSADKEAQNFQEQVTIAHAAHALEWYSLLVKEGSKEAKEPFESFYETVLNEADDQRDEAHYDMAGKLYRTLQEYEKKVSPALTSPPIDERLQEIAYRKALEEMAAGKYSESRTSFKRLGKYKDAPQQANECAYLKAREYVSNKQYIKAADLFEEISGYKDADELLLKAEFDYCASVADEPDDTAFSYLEHLEDAGYPGLDHVKAEIYTLHAKIETGMNYLVGSEQSAYIRATLLGGKPDTSTHLRFEVIDLENGMSSTWTTEEELSRGESGQAAYQTSSLTENIFEKEFKVNVYADDGTRIGSWEGTFSMEFLD